MIQFINVSKTYPNGYHALDGVNFKINNGEMVLLTGPSGSGKTSIFKLLLQLSTPSHGYIFLHGHNIMKIKPSDRPSLRQCIGVVFQNPQLLLKETVHKNVALPLLVAGYQQNQIKLRVAAALKKTGLLNKSHLQAIDLSSGEQKRTEIARAIVTTPKILLIDEPTANVDSATAHEMIELFKAFNRIGITVIIATHQKDLLMGQESRILHIENGNLKQIEN